MARPPIPAPGLVPFHAELNAVLTDAQTTLDDLEGAINPALQFVTDVHVGYTIQSRLDDAQAALLATDGDALLRVFGGDNTNVGNSTTQDDDFLAFVSASSPSGCELLIGNHDRQQSSSPTWETVFGKSRNWHRDVGTTVRIIGVSPDTGADQTKPITLTPSTLTFLDDKASETTRDVIVCCHAPLQGTSNDNGANSNSLFFSAQPAADVHQVIVDNPNICAWVSGHTHPSLDATDMIRSMVVESRAIACINIPAVAYSGFTAAQKLLHPERTFSTPTALPSDAVNDINCSAFVWVTPDAVVVRLYDHVTLAWTPWQGAVARKVSREPTPLPASAVMTASPTLLLTPELSRTISGSIVPTQNGTVSVVSGDHGQAWDLTAGALKITPVTLVPRDYGTILMRTKLSSPAADRVLWEIGNTAASTDLLGLAMLSSDVNKISANHWRNSAADGSSLAVSTLISGHSDYRTYAVAWWPGGHRLMFLEPGDGTDSLVSVDAQHGGDLAWNTFGLFIGSNRLYARNAGATVESFAAFDDVLSPSDYMALASSNRQWTWEMLGGSGATILAESDAEPLIYASADASRDSDGSITPGTVGSVSVVSGDYGNAWSCTAGGKKIDVGSRVGWVVRPDRGSIVVRAKPASSGSYRSVVSIGDETADGYSCLRMYYSGANNNTAGVVAYNSNTEVGRITLTAPGGDSPASTVPHLMRWDGNTINIAIGTSATQVSGTRSAVSDFNPAKSVYLGVGDNSGNGKVNGLIEDVLIFDDWITNEEFDYLAAMTGPWHWRAL